jgi:hypothetical protein
MPTSENPPPWMSQVSSMRWMSEIFLSLTSFNKALLRFPPIRWNTPSGCVCGIVPSCGTYRRLASYSAFHLLCFLTCCLTCRIGPWDRLLFLCCWCLLSAVYFFHPLCTLSLQICFCSSDYVVYLLFLLPPWF